ncbi:MAG: hypothetical protein FWB95_03190 [Treponema sp.]|nr:hypothetical protein [Treponema sp.]
MLKNRILFLFSTLFKCCSNLPQESDNKNEENKPILKYPIILVHGIIAHDRESIINFWGRIPETFAENGIKIFLGNTDAWGSFESNAELLKDTIDKVLLETRSGKVNIIAHSKGGLDSRYLIKKYNYGGKVASLTTISTPHHGAELADLIFHQKIVHTKSVKKALEIYGHIIGDINPDLYSVNYELTTQNMKVFNENIIPDEQVFYQSVYTTMKNAFDDIAHFNNYLSIRKVSGDNDGLVSEVSARWSDNIKKYENISHTEILDIKKRKISGIHIPDIYMDIVRALGERGF